MPLHVQVAQALGWTELTDAGSGFWDGTPTKEWAKSQGFDFIPRLIVVPRYDSDWSATGPLIERLKLNLQPYYDDPAKAWVAFEGRMGINGAEFLLTAPTPLTAVCNLILQLHKAGKLV